MAKKNATAGATTTTSTRADVQESADASKALDKKIGKAKSATDQKLEEQQAKNEPEEIPSIEEIARRATLAERRTASPANTAPTKFDLTVNVTKEEAEEINKLLAASRLQARIDAGEKIRKAYLVNDTGSDRVRWGGVSYLVPEGRNELTPEFVEKYFPNGITSEDLEKGLLGSRIKVEYADAAEAKPKQAKAPKATRAKK